MICKNCGKEIYWDDPVYAHIITGSEHCDLVATPILGHINRYLDAATILAEMEARRPAPPPAKGAPT